LDPHSRGTFCRLENDRINSQYDERWESKTRGEKNNAVRFLPLLLLHGKEPRHDESERPRHSDHGVVNPHGIRSMVYRARYRQISLDADGCKLQNGGAAGEYVHG